MRWDEHCCARLKFGGRWQNLARPCATAVEQFSSAASYAVVHVVYATDPEALPDLYTKVDLSSWISTLHDSKKRGLAGWLGTTNNDVPLTHPFTTATKKNDILQYSHHLQHAPALLDYSVYARSAKSTRSATKASISKPRPEDTANPFLITKNSR